MTDEDLNALLPQGFKFVESRISCEPGAVNWIVGGRAAPGTDRTTHFFFDDYSAIEKRIAAVLASKEQYHAQIMKMFCYGDRTTKEKDSTMTTYCITPAAHGGYIVTSEDSNYRRGELLFAGYRAQCLDFIGQQYEKAEREASEKQIAAERAKEIEARVQELRDGGPAAGIA